MDLEETFKPFLDYIQKLPATITRLFNGAIEVGMILGESVGALGSALGATVPYSLIVIAVVWGIVMLAYYFTDYFIIVLSIIVKVITVVLNWYVFIYNAMAPVALPPIYSSWNSGVETIAAFFVAQAHIWCPVPDERWPPTSLQECTGIVKFANTFKEMFLLVVDITVTLVTSIVASFKEMRTTMCDKSSGSKLNCAPQQVSSLLKEYHATGNSSTDGWVQFAKVISVLFTFVIKIFMEVLIPILLLLISFLLDVLVLIIQLFQFAIMQGAGILSRLIGFALKNLANMNVESQPYVPEQDALDWLSNPPVTFLQNCPGPPFIKNLLLRALMIIKESVRAAFYAVVGFLLLVDKTFCMIFYPFECILAVILKRAAKIVSDADFFGHNIIADGFTLLASIFKDCKCSYCPVQSNMPVYWIMKTSPCNILVPDPVDYKNKLASGGVITEEEAQTMRPCCTDSPVG
jgi:hypothetical protein